MNPKYYPPAFNNNAFNCPCGVFAAQSWKSTWEPRENAKGTIDLLEINNLQVAICFSCKKRSIWLDQKMIHPSYGGVDLPNEDLSEDILQDYNEAASIINQSPRGAAALLRLAIQKLCIQLGEKGKKIDTDIAHLVEKGLPVMIQQALDIVRVVGNEAVHPGTLNFEDDSETALKLFGLINLIAEVMISQPKHVNALYNSLPADKLKGIEERDKKM